MSLALLAYVVGAEKGWKSGWWARSARHKLFISLDFLTLSARYWPPEDLCKARISSKITVRVCSWLEIGLPCEITVYNACKRLHFCAREASEWLQNLVFWKTKRKIMTKVAYLYHSINELTSHSICISSIEYSGIQIISNNSAHPLTPSVQ